MSSKALMLFTVPRFSPSIYHPRSSRPFTYETGLKVACKYCAGKPKPAEKLKQKTKKQS